jgi:hypothetical protein
MEIDDLGSKETSWIPGPRYLMTLLIAGPPPHATILSKYCGRYSVRSITSSPPCQYTAVIERTTGCDGSTSAMVRRTATVVNGSLDGILKRLTALTMAPCAMDATHPAGALPASMCTIHGGKARTASLLP